MRWVAIKKYITINGGMGAGKTEVGRSVAEKLYGTAFIDGDFIIEIHPFGCADYTSTKAMRLDNILHLSKNYYNFDDCKNIVLSWIMYEDTASELVAEISKLDVCFYHFVLTCNAETLTERWKNDEINDWRNDENLQTAIEQLEYFRNLPGATVIDTSELSVDMVANEIIVYLRALENSPILKLDGRRNL